MNITFSYVCQDAVDGWAVFGAIITFLGIIVALVGVISNSFALKKQSNYNLLEKRIETYTYFKDCLFLGKTASLEYVSYLKLLFSRSLFDSFFSLRNRLESNRKIIEVIDKKQLLILSLAKEDINKAISMDEEFVKILYNTPSVPLFSKFRSSCKAAYGLSIEESEFEKFKVLFETYLLVKREFDTVENEIHAWLTRLHNEIYRGVRTETRIHAWLYKRLKR